MAEQPSRRLIVGIGGGVILIAGLTALYIVFLRPQMKEWTKINREIKDRKAELVRLQEAFGEQKDPKVMLKTLRLEIQNLGKAKAALNKIKRPGTEMKDMPVDLMDPDEEIRKALFDEYIKLLMETEEANIEKALKAAKIDPPVINLLTPLRSTVEAPYYINRQTGLQGIINALVKTQESSGDRILFQELDLEDYAKGIERRSGSQNVLSYYLVLTMDMDNLISFIYNLRDEEGYYYVEEMTIKPATRQRFGTKVELLVDARINTVLIYKSEELKEIQKAVQRSEVKSQRQAEGGTVGGFLALAAGIQKTTQKQIEREKNKKWYEFWK